MRRFALLALAMLSLAMTACSSPRPPVGRWEGVYDGPDLMIVARLEIGTDGVIRVSAPNASGEFGAMSDEDRTAIHDKLVTGMVMAWSNVAGTDLVFDGKVFHKPGGVAPQLEWNEGAKTMTLVFYAGVHPAVHVPLTKVETFGDSTG